MINKENPVSIEWKRRYEMLPKSIKNKLDELSKKKPKEYQLKVIKKAKEDLVEGDVFLLSPRENIYFYGKILKIDINHVNNDLFVNGKNVVLIFQNKSSTLSIENYNPDYNKLLIRPAIVDYTYWSKGLFYTVGNVGLNKFDTKLDYGFYNIGVNNSYFCKEDGTILNHEPKIVASYGITTITGIASMIEKELIINPEMLKFN